jgi:pimeloyl-ACP methyl ester carboxylesterase
MKTDLIELRAKDGTWLDGLWFTPDDEPHPGKVGITQVHGIGPRFYNRIKRPALAFTGAGFSFLSAHNRGGSERTQAKEIFVDCVHSIQAKVDFLMEQGYQKVIIMGESLGGAKGVYYAVTCADPHLSGLVLVSAIPSVELPEEYRQAIVQIANQYIEKGDGDFLFTYRLGNDIYLFEPNAVIENYVRREIPGRKGFSTLDYLKRVKVPILSTAAEFEWDWFLEVTRNVKQVAVNSLGVSTFIFKNQSEHGYLQPDVVLDWIRASVMGVEK